MESHQYRAIRRLLKSNTRVSRIKLLTCLGLETVALRYNVLSAKWFDRVQHLKGTNFLVKQAWIDFSQRPKQLSQSSSFYYPAKKNPLITNFYNYCTSSSAIEPTSAIDSLLAIDSVTLLSNLSSLTNLLTPSNLYPPTNLYPPSNMYLLSNLYPALESVPALEPSCTTIKPVLANEPSLQLNSRLLSN